MAEQAPSPQEMARAIDAHFDALLVDGMDFELAREVERQRAEAHRKATNQAMSDTLGLGFQRIMKRF